MRGPLFVICLALVLVPPAVEAGESVCTPGKRVKNPGGDSGVVVEARDSGTMCVYLLDDGTRKTSLTWMLARDGGKAATAKSPSEAKAGDYRCSMGAAGGFNFQLHGPTSYATSYTGQEPKRGEYTNKGGKLSFTSGPLAGMYGAVLSEGKIGLSTKRSGGAYYATCDLQQ